MPEVQEEKPVEPILGDEKAPVAETETKGSVVQTVATSEETSIETGIASLVTSL